MPRRKVEPEPVVIPTASLVASATRYPGKAARIYQPRQDWQAECYRHYTICGEARFAAKFFGHSVSRATLFAGEIVSGEVKKQDSGPAVDALTDLFNGRDGQTQMLDAIGTHLTIAGECYLVGREIPGEDGNVSDNWEIVSCLEMQVSGTNWQINYGNGLPVVDLTENDVVIRIWLPSPARRVEADSPFRALLPILSEIEWLTRHVFAQITSRLAGAGVLIMPQGMSFPPPPGQAESDVPPVNDADAFMATLAEAMMTPIEDPSSPSALVPIVITAPDDTIDKPRLLKFWSDLDNAAMGLRNEAIRRFALGMDLPPEQVLGMSGTTSDAAGNVSHWGAWQVEESTIKLHIEPMLDVIVNAITVGYMRPLTDDGSLVAYDSSALRLRPDRSKEAFELYDRGLITPEALLRENGFDINDMPDEAHRKMWLLIKVASGSATPEQVGAALDQLGVHLGVISDPDTTRESRPNPSLEEHPTRPRDPSESALVAASEALVFRALERAGNRLRQSVSRPPGAPAYETHVYVKANGTAEKLLEDAWSCAPQVLAGIADPDAVIPVLSSYCVSLMAEQSPHRRERLVNWLRLAEQVPA